MAGLEIVKELESVNITMEDIEKIGTLGVNEMLDVLDDVEGLLKEVGVNLLELEEIEKLKEYQQDRNEGKKSRKSNERKKPDEPEGEDEKESRKRRVEALKRKQETKTGSTDKQYPFSEGEEDVPISPPPELAGSPPSAGIQQPQSPPQQPRHQQPPELAEGEDLLGFLKNSRKGLSGALSWDRNKEESNKEKLIKEQEEAQERRTRKKALSMLGVSEGSLARPPPQQPQHDNATTTTTSTNEDDEECKSTLKPGSRTPEPKRRGKSFLGAHHAMQLEKESLKQRFEKGKGKFKQITTRKTKMEKLWEAEMEAAMLAQEERRRMSLRRKQKRREEEAEMKKLEGDKQKLLNQARLVDAANDDDKASTTTTTPATPATTTTPATTPTTNTTTTTEGDVAVAVASPDAKSKATEAPLQQDLTKEPVEAPSPEAKESKSEANVTAPVSDDKEKEQKEEKEKEKEKEVEKEQEKGKEKEQLKEEEEDLALDEREGLLQRFLANKYGATREQDWIHPKEGQSRWIFGMIKPRRVQLINATKKIERHKEEEDDGSLEKDLIRKLIEEMKKEVEQEKKQRASVMLAPGSTAGLGVAVAEQELEIEVDEETDEEIDEEEAKLEAEVHCNYNASTAKPVVEVSVAEEEEKRKSGLAILRAMEEGQGEEGSRASVVKLKSFNLEQLIGLETFRRTWNLSQELTFAELMEAYAKAGGEGIPPSEQEFAEGMALEAKEREKEREREEKEKEREIEGISATATATATPTTKTEGEEKVSTSVQPPEKETKPKEETLFANFSGSGNVATKKPTPGAAEVKGPEEGLSLKERQRREKEAKKEQAEREKKEKMLEKARKKAEAKELKKAKKESKKGKAVESDRNTVRQTTATETETKPKEAEATTTTAAPAIKETEKIDKEESETKKEEEQEKKKEGDEKSSYEKEKEGIEQETQERETQQQDLIEVEVDESGPVLGSSTAFEDLMLTSPKIEDTNYATLPSPRVPFQDMTGEISVLSDPFVFDKTRGTIYYLKEGENTIGRSSQNAVPVPSINVSRRHCCINVDGINVTIIDLFSTHGTLVNGRTITTKTELKRGDELLLGTTTLTFGWRIPVMEGKLMKKSPAFHKKWQTRYCALKEKREGELVLYYFKSAKDKKTPTGSVNISSVLTISDEDGNTFKMKTTERVWNFQAPNEEAKSKWMKALCNALRAHKQKTQGGTIKRDRSASAKPLTTKVVNVGEKRHRRSKSGSSTSMAKLNKAHSNLEGLSRKGQQGTNSKNSNDVGLSI